MFFEYFCPCRMIDRLRHSGICVRLFAIVSLGISFLPSGFAEEQKPAATQQEEPSPDPAALMVRADDLLKDQSNPGNTQMAVLFLAQAAAAGHAEAANRLGYLYDMGKGVAADDVKALEWFQKAADAGLPKAKFNLGRFLILGLGGASDADKGIWYLEAAANEGVVPAQVALAKMFFFGESGQNIDYKRAFPYALLAAEAGDAEGQNMVGVMRNFGWGVNRDKSEAAKWFSKAAEQGHAKAQASYADALLNGTGVKMNKVEAIKFYTLSANQGEVTGKNPLEDLSAGIDPAILAEGTLRAQQFSAQKRNEEISKKQGE